MARDDFRKPIVEVLKMRAAYICSNPSCKKMTVAPSDTGDDKVVYMGRAAHICAASPDGPRYDATMTSEERGAITNAIFLCGNCADIIDDNGGLDYSVELLHQWKSEHEKWVRANLNKSVGENSDAAAMKKQLSRIESLQTGGDTFCYWMLYHFDLKLNIAQQFVISKSGEYPLYDLRYTIYDVLDKKQLVSKQHGELNTVADFHLVKWPMKENEYYRVTFFARNGNWTQDLILKKSLKAECWLAATIVRDRTGRNIVHKHIDNGFVDEFGEPAWQP